MATAKNGNWVEEWREALKNTTLDEIEAIADRLEAEHPERRGLTPEELDEKYGRPEKPQTAPRRAELVGV
jgi:phytoene dehydrogenase-like protein